MMILRLSQDRIELPKTTFARQKIMPPTKAHCSLKSDKICLFSLNQSCPNWILWFFGWSCSGKAFVWVRKKIFLEIMKYSCAYSRLFLHLFQTVWWSWASTVMVQESENRNLFESENEKKNKNFCGKVIPTQFSGWKIWLEKKNQTKIFFRTMSGFWKRGPPRTTPEKTEKKTIGEMQNMWLCDLGLIELSHTICASVILIDNGKTINFECDVIIETPLPNR